MSGVLFDVLAFLGGFRLSASSKKIAMDSKFAEKEITVLESEGWSEFAAGLASTDITVEGFLSSAEKQRLEQFGKQALCFAKFLGREAGARAEIVESVCLLGDTMNLEVGEPIGTQNSLRGNSAPIYGQVLFAGAAATTASPQIGNVITLPAIAADEDAVLAWAVVDPPGISGMAPGFQVTWQSCTLADFSGTVATRMTRSRATVGAEIVKLSGPISDLHHRLQVVTSGAGTGGFVMAAAGVKKR